LNRNLEKSLNSLDLEKKTFDLPKEILEKPIEIREKTEIQAENKESLEMLAFFKEKKLIKSQIEGFLEYQKKSPAFSRKQDISSFLKYVTFSDIHRDFLKVLKEKDNNNKTFAFLKRISKRSMNLIPEDIADIDYGLKNYEEKGLKFDVSDK